MPRARTVDPEKTPIAWVPEEGCYRIVEHHVETATVGGAEIAVDVAEFGDRVVWVDEAPGDIEDGSGHFQVYSGDDDDYRASIPDPNADGEED